MTDVLNHLHEQLQSWVGNARSGGWLNQSALLKLQSTTTATPGSLFDKPNRPLVVGFFGGTGVGKSTLLNRFAGEPVARTSVERPTSTDITVYLHKSVTLDQLPEDFPVQRLHTAVHQNNVYRSVMWVDMPDFDSVEQSHRQLVEQWLPHIDIVMYVVSPERYRDDQGWRLLLDHGHQHAWIFVMNHWDRGDPQQKEDFYGMLNDAGLAEPLIYCTDCSDPESPGNDDFNALRDTISELADQQLVGQLEQRGIVQRLEQIKQTSNTLRAQLGTAEDIDALGQYWHSHWPDAHSALGTQVQWKIPGVAKQFVEHEPGLLSVLLNRKQRHTPEPEAPVHLPQQLQQLTDAAFFDRIDNAVDESILAGSKSGLPHKALQPHAEALKSALRTSVPAQLEQSVQQSLAVPGNALQRGLYTLLGVLIWLLPLAALGWISYRVINVFRLGAHDPAAYLSSNFAVHSVLLVALAWLVPALLRHQLKPSREKAAARGLENGMAVIAANVSDQFEHMLESVKNDQRVILRELDSALETGIGFDENRLPASLQRMLLAPPGD